MRTLRRSWRGWIGAATGLLTLAAFGSTQIGAPGADLRHTEGCQGEQPGGGADPATPRAS